MPTIVQITSEPRLELVSREANTFSASQFFPLTDKFYKTQQETDPNPFFLLKLLCYSAVIARPKSSKHIFSSKQAK